MMITDEILAAYIDGTLPTNQSEEVRKYLATHPQELEQMVKLMDAFPYDPEDNDLNKGDSMLYDLKKPSIASSGSAFVVRSVHKASPTKVRETNIQTNLTNLLNEII